MNFLRRCANLFYMTIVMVVGCFFLLLSLKWIKLGSLVMILQTIYTQDRLRLIIGITAGVILFKNFLYYQLLSMNLGRKTIAFDNPSGRVSVSLSALEDLIRRTINKFPEVKQSKSNVVTSKKGLRVTVKLILRSGRNIPELTSRIQDLVQNKVHEMIGISEPVNVTVYISKIVPDKDSDRDSSEKIREEKLEPHIPFHGYRA